MRRRQFIACLGGAAAWPVAVRAQYSERPRRIGILITWSESDLEAQVSIRALVDHLQVLGWIDGRNARIDYRWGAADPARRQILLNELLQLKPDLIVACAAQAATAFAADIRTVPGVFVQVVYPLSI
jgi:putative ABC transport system substrate-binding protein